MKGQLDERKTDEIKEQVGEYYDELTASEKSEI